ncbi:MAG: hypothetical protein IFNCLDLE_02342 [Ignavibacteriaceae bacterium]|jgi:hypothetical protein|nr:hypothetical protein [Ignavibacteriaceae bacterium]OQY79716.1 MAG: hypothetical protein B6D45_00375 [Ignavibacteriales bacterium UTCHB3]
MCLIDNSRIIKQNLKNRIISDLFLLSETKGKETSGFASIFQDKIEVCEALRLFSELLKSKFFRNYKNLCKTVQEFIGHSWLVTNEAGPNDEKGGLY